MESMIQGLDTAFLGENLTRYIELVQKLPESNLFAATLQVYVLEDQSTMEGSEGSSVGAIIGSTAALVGFAFLAFFYSRKRDISTSGAAIKNDFPQEESSTEGSTTNHEYLLEKLSNSGTSSRSSRDTNDNVGNNDNDVKDWKEVWDRYKSPEFLSFRDSDHLGEAGNTYQNHENVLFEYESDEEEISFDADSESRFIKWLEEED